MTSTTDFAARCRSWLGDIIPTVRRIEGSIVGRNAPGAVIATAQNGALWLFATGYPTQGPEGEETYSEAEIWICDGVGGDVAPILALSGARRRPRLPRLNTPHARRHLRRLIRRGFALVLHGPTEVALERTDKRGTVAYTGTIAQAIALAAGRRQPTSGGWNGEAGADSEDLISWSDLPRASRPRARGRAAANRPARLVADRARMDAEDAARGYDRDLV